MEAFADKHPVVFTILALPVVATFCLTMLSFFGISLAWRRR